MPGWRGERSYFTGEIIHLRNIFPETSAKEKGALIGRKQTNKQTREKSSKQWKGRKEIALQIKKQNWKKIIWSFFKRIHKTNVYKFLAGENAGQWQLITDRG